MAKCALEVARVEDENALVNGEDLRTRIRFWTCTISSYALLAQSVSAGFSEFANFAARQSAQLTLVGAFLSLIRATSLKV